ncbi:glycosyltransferase [Streptomyces sp. CB03234]|uniref:glycosyltransferase n=1 Tax=Streptomyces sp. (strain CB03234) TaxID=1703937 RepID=UPI001F51765F|nr:glycosyltransferase [Streptomyces sp. CB03234]
MVVFHGRLPDPRRDALLATAWMTVTTAAREGWGLSVMEAAAAGVPALAYDVPGLRDTVHDGRTGWLLGPDEDLSTVLTTALRALVPEAEAAAWDGRCRARAESFTWPATAAHLLAALTEERHRLRSSRRGTGASARDRRLFPRHPAFSSPPACRPDRPARHRPLDVSAPRARLLLPGTDEHDARAVLDRMGVDPGDRRVRVRLARHRDTVGWRQHPPCCPPDAHRPERAERGSAHAS